MKYVGSKARHSKHILNAIKEDLGDSLFCAISSWIEPFVGGSNMIENVPTRFLRYGFDKNPYVISLSQALQLGWEPPTSLSYAEYQQYSRLSREGIVSPDIAFAGFCCSFGAKWFGGYARGKDAGGNPRNYCLEQRRALLKQASKIHDVIYAESDYRNIVFSDPGSCIIYCDPPYSNTQGYSHDVGNGFWEWARTLSKLGHHLFVSEYNSPNDFVSVWEREISSSLDVNTGGKRATERLFRLESA